MLDIILVDSDHEEVFNQFAVLLVILGGKVLLVVGVGHHLYGGLAAEVGTVLGGYIILIHYIHPERVVVARIGEQKAAAVVAAADRLSEHFYAFSPGLIVLVDGDVGVGLPQLNGVVDVQVLSVLLCVLYDRAKIRRPVHYNSFLGSGAVDFLVADEVVLLAECLLYRCLQTHGEA